MAHDGAQHSLQVESRADRLANFAQRSQLPDGLRQLARAGLQLLEQPHILNGDHSLVGEGLQ